jgi:hypothetical protein
MAIQPEDLILISVDDHICEPAEMFEGRLPKKYQAEAPFVSEDANGRQQWWYQGKPGRNLGLNAAAGKPREYYNTDAHRYDEMRRGCWDVNERVRDMSAGGILAGLNFPNFTGFAGQVLNQGPDPRHERRDDPGLQRLAHRRLVRRPSGPLHPLRHPAALRSQARRRRDPPSREEGLPRRHLLREPRGPRHALDPLGKMGRSLQRLQRRGDDPLLPHRLVLEELRDLEGRPALGPDDLSSAMAIFTLGDLIWNDIWWRFPDLKFSLTEGDVGWIPYFLWRAEHVQRRHSGWTGHKFPDGTGPTDVFLKHVLCCFISDPIGIELIDHFNVDNLCWESDFPHSDTNWPNAPEELSQLLGALPNETIARITHQNAMKHFQFDPFKHRRRRSAARVRCARRRRTSTS